MRYYIFFILTGFLALITLSFINLAFLPVSAQEPGLKAPGTFKEAKTTGERALGAIPGVFKELWQEALGIGQKIKSVWSRYINPKISVFGQKILSVFNQEAKKRKEIIKKEFPEEKQELKEEVPKVGKSLWQKFKELIK